MRTIIRVAIAVLFALSLAAPVSRAAAARVGAHDDGPSSAPADDSSAPKETSSVTQHTMRLNGQALDYTATAGTLVIRDNDGKPYGSVFYVAYTKNGVSDPDRRPVTFLYNGGPGSASLWLHMGSVGPMRVETSSPAATGPAPYHLVPNQDTLLDVSDLVFIDAVGTGFSKPAGKATEKDFAGTDEDVRAFDRFITRYITVNKRWNSPKFLFGESYGTTRSAALADALENDGIACNGVILVSSILDYDVMLPGSDRRYIGYLPSYAAIAYYHDKLAQKPANLEAFLKQVREFALGPYSKALAQGDKLSAEERDAVAAKISAFTGLSVQYVKDANLRVAPANFRKELLRGEQEILGRYDARFEGSDIDGAGATPGYDPSETGIKGAFVAAFHDYLTQTLKYSSEDPYHVTESSVIQMWDWKHHLPDGQEDKITYVVPDLADAMRKDPKLKVFSANGLFDLATPFTLTEYDLAHMDLKPEIQANLEFGYYPSGHMIYLNVDALKSLAADLRRFYATAAP